ncbi:phage portal protein [Nocardioides alkalitolerans]|uniref:phage portal protein n=1 Tax=Nocardioides alkalitolerans TaxID=281714 RepID=UPI00041EB052|nr:phage portal protein [Nocardioides alkalitolerans]
MTVVRRLLGREVRSSRRMPMNVGTATTAGVSITPELSLQVGAVYSCVRLMSEAGSGLPVSMFDRIASSRQQIAEHPVLTLVRDEPNPNIDAAELWRLVIGWMMLRGNGFVYIERNGAGGVQHLWPIKPTSIEPKRTAVGELVYKVTLDADEYAPIREPGGLVRRENMLHYRAFGLDDVLGLSPIGLIRQSVGIGWAAQSYMGGFYARDASPGGSIVVPGELSEPAFERLTQQWRDMHEGFGNSHRLAVLEGGAEWKSTTLSPADAAFIETQKFTRGDIASIYGVPPHMIGDTEKSTSWGSGIAEQGIGFVTYSLRQYTSRLERVTRRLLVEPNRRFRWNVEGLQQGDMKARYDAYAVGKQWGWLSTNDIRSLEDEEPVEGGDVYLQPLNMVPAGDASAPNARARQGRATRAADVAPADTVTPWVVRHRDLLVEVFEEQRAEILASIGTGAATLDREAWDAELTTRLVAPSLGLTSELAGALALQLGGAYDPSLALAFLAGEAARHATNINITTADALARALASDGDETPAARVGRVFDDATTSRAGEVATGIVNQLGNFADHEGATQAGARSKTWRTTSSNSRSTHARMDGETVAITDKFSNGMKWPGDSRNINETAGCQCRVEYTQEAP